MTAGKRGVYHKGKYRGMDVVVHAINEFQELKESIIKQVDELR